MNSDALLRYMPILLILLIGAALRFYGLGHESLWLDEALSWQQAQLPLPALLDSVAADVHPPLYALLLHAFIAAFGDSEASLRLLSAICGTLCIPLTWAICRMLGGDRSAWIAALLVALSSFAIQYAQEARMYALLCCLALASMLSFMRISYTACTQRDDRDDRATAVQILYIVTTTLMIYSHVYGLFIAIAQNVVMAVRYLPGWPQQPALPLRRWIILQVVLGGLLLPWLFVLAGQVARVQSSFWIDPPALANLLDTFREYMGVLPALQLGCIGVIAAVLALLRPSAKLQLPVRNEQAADRTLLPIDTALLLFVWLIVPIAVPFLLSLLVQPIYMPRYTIASSPAWFMLVAIGISSMSHRWVRNGLLGLLLLAMLPVLPIYYSSNTKTPWPAVVALVEDNANPGDLVLFHNPDVLVPWQYYRQRRDLDLQTVVAADTWQAAGVTDWSKPDVRNIARDYPQVWLVSGYDRKTAITELEIVRQLADVLTPLGGREFDAIRVFRFASMNSRPAPPAGVTSL